MSGTQTADPPAAGGTEIPAAPDPSVIDRARRMGWRPKEEYTGDPSRWQEPQDFIERAETMLPLAVARNKRLERDLETLRGTVDQQTQMLSDMVKRTRRAEEIGYKRARREIEEERAKAVAAGDTEGFNAAEQKLRDLGPEPEPERAPARTGQPAEPSTTSGQPAQPGRMDPVVEAWIAQHPWFNTNPEANAVAVALHGVISNQMPSASLEEKLAETTRRMRQRMPELFGQPGTPANGEPPATGTRRQAQAAVSPSQSLGSRAAAPRSFDAMPAEVKREYDRQAKMLQGKGEPFTKEEFARYYWDQFEETA